MNLSKVRLKYLYETAKLGTMRAASEKLDIASSSISRQLAELEKEVGMPLFEKGKRRLKLTEAGEFACRYYRETCSRQEAFISQIKDLKSLNTGNVRLAVGEAFVTNAFDRQLQNFMLEYPGISVKVDVASTSEVINLVREDEAHFGLIFSVSSDPNIRTKQTHPAPIKVITHRDHPLAKQKKISLAELSQYDIALPATSFRIQQIIDQAVQESGVFLEPHLSSNSFSLLKGFIASGRGITLLPELATQHQLRSGEFVAITTDNEILNSTQTSLITRLGRELPSSSYKLSLYIEEYFKEIAKYE